MFSLRFKFIISRGGHYSKIRTNILLFANELASGRVGFTIPRRDIFDKDFVMKIRLVRKLQFFVQNRYPVGASVRPTLRGRKKVDSRLALIAESTGSCKLIFRGLGA